jgi:hypothetical protein
MMSWSLAEVCGANIANTRRRNNIASILDGLAENPALSFSAAVGSAKRQAFHRLCRMDTSGEKPVPLVKVDDLLGGHFEQTQSRIGEETGGGLVLFVQDTTMFNFAGLKQVPDLGYCNSKGERCLFGHSMIAVSVDGLPLGVAHLDLWCRDEADHGKTKARRDKQTKDKESFRWIRALQTVEERLPEGQPALFIQDREADIFAFLEAPKRATTFVLVRAAQSRRVEVDVPGDDKPQKGLLLDVAHAAPVVGQMQVSIPRAPNREASVINLLVQTVCVRIIPPSDRKGIGDKPVTAWVVRASEMHPPAGEKAIEWILVTTMPVTTPEQAFQMVRYYSKRWVIERLHFTIKSGGCNAERLQMDDVHSIKLALTLYYVTAWRLLFITYLARTKPEAPAAIILNDTEIQLLQMIEKKPVTTCAMAVVAMAKLGGYEPYKNGPPPGVKRLWIGLRRMEDMAAGWQLAKQGLTLIPGRVMIHD